MDIVGFALIGSNPEGISPLPMSSFENKVVRVLEFNEEGGVFVVDSQAAGLGSFDKKDVRSSFKCKLEGDVICPPGLDFIQVIEYTGRVFSRKGGYNDFMKKMVIAASLTKGEFDDSVLWAGQ